MSDREPVGADYDIKQCGRCAANIPRSATMCAYCGTTSPNTRIDPRPTRSPLGLPRNVTVTRLLIAANCLYFLFSVWVQFRAVPGTNVAKLMITGSGFSAGLAYSGMYMHDRIFVGHEWWRVIACTFLHGGLIHIGFNMYALNQLGHIAEEIFGGAKLLAIYLVCGVCSSLAVSVYNVGILRLDPSQVPPLVGASGAIFGVGGVLAVFLLKRGSAQGKKIGWALTQNLAAMLLIGFMIRMISNTAHVGGMIPGALFGLVVREQFSTFVSPTARRNWWLAATIATIVAIVALALAVHFTVTNLGGS